MMTRRTLLAAVAAGAGLALTGDTMPTTDIADLFLPPPPGPSQPATFRQGVVEAWDPLTAANSVNVGGTVLTDLPVLNTSEALLIAPGDVVSIVVMTPGGGGAATFAILGRLTIPGTSVAATALNALRAVSADVAAAESTSSGTFTDLATPGPEAADVLVSNSGRALVIVSAEITVDTAKGSAISSGWGVMSYAVSGATSVSPLDTWAAQAFIRYDATGDNFALEMRMSASRLSLQTNLNPGLHTFTAKYKSNARTPEFDNRNITVIPL